MAEVVQSNIEDSLPEVYELQQLGVLSHVEAKSVIRERTKFEYMMRRRISKKQDIIRFIEFELKLEKLKQFRISSLRLQDISEGARYRSLQRIHFLFQKCLKKNKNDISLWMRYIKYCKEVESFRSLGLAFSQGLKHNPYCITMWILSAKNEMETNKNMSAARHIFLQGLNFNSKSVNLWTEYFRLEMLHAEKLQKRHQIMNSCDKSTNKHLNDSFLNYKTAKIVFNNAIENIILSAENITDFVNIAKVSENGLTLTKFILESALQKFPENPSIWVAMAEFVITTNSKSAEEILQTALKMLQNIACLTAIINFVIKYKKKIVDFQSCIARFCVSIETISINDPDSAINLGSTLAQHSFISLCHEIISIAQDKFPNNKSLWLFRIHNISVNPIQDLEKALIQIPDDTDIWIEYLALVSSVDTVKCSEIWESLIEKYFAEPLIAHYLEFVYTTSGFTEVCKKFDSLQNIHVIPEIGIKCMLTYTISNNSNNESVCTTFDILTQKYNTDSNWQWYFKYCKEYCPERLSSVVWKRNGNIF